MEELRAQAAKMGHTMSHEEHCVDVTCCGCIDCGMEIIVNRDSGKLSFDEALVNECSMKEGE